MCFICMFDADARDYITMHRNFLIITKSKRRKMRTAGEEPRKENMERGGFTLSVLAEVVHIRMMNFPFLQK